MTRFQMISKFVGILKFQLSKRTWKSIWVICGFNSRKKIWDSHELCMWDHKPGSSFDNDFKNSSHQNKSNPDIITEIQAGLFWSYILYQGGSQSKHLMTYCFGCPKNVSKRFQYSKKVKKSVIVFKVCVRAWLQVWLSLSFFRGRLIKWVAGTPGNLVVKIKLCPYSVFTALR